MQRFGVGPHILSICDDDDDIRWMQCEHMVSIFHSHTTLLSKPLVFWPKVRLRYQHHCLQSRIQVHFMQRLQCLQLLQEQEVAGKCCSESVFTRSFPVKSPKAKDRSYFRGCPMFPNVFLLPFFVCLARLRLPMKGYGQHDCKGRRCQTRMCQALCFSLFAKENTLEVHPLGGLGTFHFQMCGVPPDIASRSGY